MTAYALGYIIPTKLEPGETDNGWKICYGVCMIIPIIRIFFFTFFFKEETPFYLISKQRNDEAEKVLQKSIQGDVKPVLADIIKDREL